jgi:hypothetical protein
MERGKPVSEAPKPGTPEFETMTKKNMDAFWKRYENGEVTKEKTLEACIAEANFSDEFDMSLQVTCEFRLK